MFLQILRSAEYKQKLESSLPSLEGNNRFKIFYWNQKQSFQHEILVPHRHHKQTDESWDSRGMEQNVLMEEIDIWFLIPSQPVNGYYYHAKFERSQEKANLKVFFLQIASQPNEHSSLLHRLAWFFMSQECIVDISLNIVYIPPFKHGVKIICSEFYIGQRLGETRLLRS